jgi:flagellar biosynthesis GTPase FlhF
MKIPEFLKSGRAGAPAAPAAPAAPRLPRFDPTFVYLGGGVLAAATAMSWRGWFILGRLCGMVTPEAAGLSLLTDGFAGAMGRAAFGVPYASKRTRTVARFSVIISIAASMAANGLSIYFAADPGVMHHVIHSAVHSPPMWLRFSAGVVAPLAAGQFLIVHAFLHRDYKAWIKTQEAEAVAARKAEAAEAAAGAEAAAARQAEAVAAATRQAEAVRSAAQAEADRLRAEAAATTAQAEADQAAARRIAAEQRAQSNGIDRNATPPRQRPSAERAKRPAVTSRQASAESIDRLMKAMDILRDESEINGADLGARCGISKRGGRDLLKRARDALRTEADAMAAAEAGSAGSGTGSGSGSGSDAR